MRTFLFHLSFLGEAGPRVVGLVGAPEGVPIVEDGVGSAAGCDPVFGRAQWPCARMV